MQQKPCRKCLLRDFGEEEYQTIIKKNIDILKKEDRASKELTEKRLDVCRACDRLHMGTCQACGCYVEIRAAVIRSKCPKKKW